MERNENRGTKIRKLIWEGDAVKVSASYQWATISFYYSCIILLGGEKSIPYAERPTTTMAKTNCAMRRGRSNPNAILLDFRVS